jgi:5'-nucleotidase
MGALGMAIATGCATNKKSASTAPSNGLAMNSAVTDITPPPAPAVAPTPIPVQTTPTPAPSETVTPAPAATAGGTSYTVKRGDTLYSIARAHYGDGKQYKKILAANPGLSPTHMKVGQVLSLP